MSRGDEVLALTEPDDQGWAVPRDDERVRVVARQIRTIANSPRSRRAAPPRGRLQAVAAHLALHQVRDDLGVGLGDEPVALLLELALEVRGSSR